jgi:hypothetical protein
MASSKEFDKDYKKLMKKDSQSQARQEKHMKKIGDHYKKTEYSTPKEASKGSMLQKRSAEEHQRNVRRSKRFSDKHK